MATPTFTPPAGAYGANEYPKTVTISTTTVGAKICWTSNGTAPTTDGSTCTNGNLINGSSGNASVPAGATLKALAYRGGYNNSAVKSGVYSVAPGVVEPAFNPAGYNYYPQTSIAPVISTTTVGAKICWTSDGSTPTTNGSTCTRGTLINGNSGSAPCSPFYEGTLKAMAFKSGLSNSPVHSEYYWRDSGMTPGAPDSGPPHTVTSKASAFKSGMTDSLVHEDYYEGDSGMNPNTTRTVTYNLDKAGNRTSIVDSGVTKTYTPNNLNQYNSAEGVAVSNGSEHEVSEYQGVAYTYRNDERLVRVTSGLDTYDLAYDALGRCVKRTLNNVTTFYIYDGERSARERSDIDGQAREGSGRK